MSAIYRGLEGYDGDTLNVAIPDTHPLFGEKIGIRVRGIDTPEISTKNTCEKSAGRIAKNLAESILKKAKRIDLENVSRDKYFRILADVKADGVSLADIMMKNKLANKYDGGTKIKQDWCSFDKNRIPASTGK